MMIERGTLDAMVEKIQSENALARFKAIGWDVLCDRRPRYGFSHLKALMKAKRATRRKPQLIIARRLLEKGIRKLPEAKKGAWRRRSKNLFDAPSRR